MYKQRVETKATLLKRKKEAAASSLPGATCTCRRPCPTPRVSRASSHPCLLRPVAVSGAPLALIPNNHPPYNPSCAARLQKTARLQNFCSLAANCCKKARLQPERCSLARFCSLARPSRKPGCRPRAAFAAWAGLQPLLYFLLFSFY